MIIKGHLASKEKKLELYRDFIRQCTSSPASAENYSDFSKINRLIRNRYDGFTEILDYDSPIYLQKIYDELSQLNFFEELDGTADQGKNFKNIGNRYYHNALLMYIKFLKAMIIFGDFFDNKDSRFAGDNSNTQSLQQIYYGAPGTGKSHEIKELTEGKLVIRTTFHPDSDYSTFVGAYKPTTIEVPMRDVTGKVIVENGEPVTENRIVYEFVEQAFLQAYTKAWKRYASATAEGKEPEEVYLIIEEINRGNCAQIFGDLFQLLDRGDNGFSEYPIVADKDLQKQLAKAFGDMAFLNAPAVCGMSAEKVALKIRNGEILLLPNNLYIWATMNTSDQSLFPIDSAFKRRWDWQYIPISDGRRGWAIEANGKQYDWWEFLQKMNDKIGSTTNSEDKKLGYYFCKAKDGIINAETFVGKVIFYIWNDVFKDFAEDAGDLFKDTDGTLLSFNKFFAIGEDGKTRVVEEKVAKLLNNLGVEFREKLEDDIIQNDTPYGKHKYLNSISFPDKTVLTLENRTHFVLYLDALKKIGLDKVYPLISKMKYKRLGFPLMTLEKFQEIDNSTAFSYHQEGKYYIVKGVSDETLINILSELDKELNLQLSIDYTVR